MKIEINSVSGGNGDIWMRLVSFYSVAALLPGVNMEIYIPSIFKNLAQLAFGNRLTIKTGEPGRHAFQYTSLGVKDLLVPSLKGKKFLSPYARTVLHDRHKKDLKYYISNTIYYLTDIIGVVQVPPKKWMDVYQGYQEIACIKALRQITYGSYLKQLEADYICLKSVFEGMLPTSKKLVVPDGLQNELLVYATGTSRQFIPLWWAKQNLSEAVYAFFYKDNTAKQFENAGLKTIFFYEEPGDIIELAKNAWYTITTDSFPSHLLQYAVTNCSVLITEVKQSRIVSPVFKGTVVNAVAPCHPCLHLDRGNHPLCAAGYKECLNWRSDIYTRNIFSSVNNKKIFNA